MNSSKAIVALLATVLLWSVFAVTTKSVITSYSPMMLLFLRFLVAVVCFSPFLIKRSLWKKKHIRSLMAISLFSTVNVAFFIWGIQYTSASASQLIYAFNPILIVIINMLFLHERHKSTTVLGVLIGLGGIIYIVYRSTIEQGTTITGSLLGNMGIIGAAFGWLLYIYLSKRMSRYFNPLEIGSVSVFVSFLVALALMIIEFFFYTSSFHLDIPLIGAILYMGVGGTFVPYILYQYALKHTSALTVSFSSYLQPISSTILAILFLGEKMTLHFFIGSLLVFAGVFIATTLELYNREKRVS